MMTSTCRISALLPVHLNTCGAIIDETPLFQRYRFDGQAAISQLGGAIDDPGADVVVATNAADEAVLGFAWIARGGAFGRSSYLRLIAVAQGHRRAGVGTALLDELERRHLASGGILLLATDDNSGSHRFYERRGYRHVGTLDDYVIDGVAERIYYKAPE